MEFLRKKTLVHIALSLTLAGVAGCDAASNLTTKLLGKANKANGEYRTGGLEISLAEDLTMDMVISLKENGVTAEQAEVIRQGALQAVPKASDAKDAGGKLHLTAIDPTSIQDIAPLVTAGAVKALNNAESGQDSDAAKVKTAGLLMTGVVRSLRTKLTKLDDDQKQDVPGAITQSALGSLDDAGVSPSAIAEGVGEVMQATVANLDDAGFSASELAVVVKKTSATGVKGLKDAGLSVKDSAAALKNLVEKSVAGLGETGYAADSVGDLVGPILEGAVGELDDLGFRPSQVGSVMDDMMQGAVGGFSGVGLTDPRLIRGALDGAVKGAMKGMTGAGVGAAQYAGTVENMMTGAISSLDDIGLKDAGSIQTISEEMIGRAVDYVDDFGITDATAVKEASLKMAEGMMVAMGEFRRQGIFSAEQSVGFAASIQQTGLKALKAQNDRYGFSAANGSELSSLFSEGIRQGLAEAKFSATEITGMADELAEAGRLGLLDADVPDLIASAAKQTTLSSVKAFANEMQVNCEKERGVWFTTGGGYCEFPLAGPPPGAVGPTLEEENGCFASGGFVMFDPNGNWFCDVVGSVELGATECRDQGLFWIADGQGGGVCETAPPPKQCYLHSTSSACTAEPGCVFAGNICQDAALLSCASSLTETSCSQSPGCLWDPVGGFCENANIVDCAATTSATCASRVGCTWSENKCTPMAAISCSGQTSSTACSATAGCGWDGDSCVNLQFMACGEQTTTSSCGSLTGCTWNPDGFCMIAAAVSCNANSNQSQCSQDAACYWDGASCLNNLNKDCTSYGDSTTCGQKGCFWESAFNECRNPAQLFCEASSQTACEDISASCIWDGVSCVNETSISCSGLGVAACTATPGCSVDVNGGCINDAAIQCGNYAASSTTCDSAPGDFCFWDSAAAGGLGACIDTSQGFCADYGANQATCEADSFCHWDATNSACQDLPNICRDLGTTAATCNNTVYNCELVTDPYSGSPKCVAAVGGGGSHNDGDPNHLAPLVAGEFDTSFSSDGQDEQIFANDQKIFSQTHLDNSNPAGFLIVGQTGDNAMIGKYVVGTGFTDMQGIDGVIDPGYTEAFTDIVSFGGKAFVVGYAQGSTGGPKAITGRFNVASLSDTSDTDIDPNTTGIQQFWVSNVDSTALSVAVNHEANPVQIYVLGNTWTNLTDSTTQATRIWCMLDNGAVCPGQASHVIFDDTAGFQALAFDLITHNNGEVDAIVTGQYHGFDDRSNMFIRRVNSLHTNSPTVDGTLNYIEGGSLTASGGDQYKFSFGSSITYREESPGDGSSEIEIIVGGGYGYSTYVTQMAIWRYDNQLTRVSDTTGNALNVGSAASATGPTSGIFDLDFVTDPNNGEERLLVTGFSGDYAGGGTRMVTARFDIDGSNNMVLDSGNGGVGTFGPLISGPTREGFIEPTSGSYSSWIYQDGPLPWNANAGYSLAVDPSSGDIYVFGTWFNGSDHEATVWRIAD